MKLSAKETNGVIVITLEGSVMGGPDAAELNNELHKLVDKKKKNIVLDLSTVKNMNSSGLSMMISAMTMLKNAGGKLKIASASEKIQNLLSITKLASVFELYPTVKKALGSFGK
jgi:anti-sigma B factor antagonist